MGEIGLESGICRVPFANIFSENFGPYLFTYIHSCIFTYKHMSVGIVIHNTYIHTYMLTCVVCSDVYLNRLVGYLSVLLCCFGAKFYGANHLELSSEAYQTGLGSLSLSLTV